MDSSRLEMENTLKTLKEKSQHIEKLLEKGNDSVIFQFGSHSIKYGKANELAPHTVRTLIAYDLKNATPDEYGAEKTIYQEEDNFDSIWNATELHLRKQGTLKVDFKSYKPKGKPRVEQISVIPSSKPQGENPMDEEGEYELDNEKENEDGMEIEDEGEAEENKKDENKTAKPSNFTYPYYVGDEILKQELTQANLLVRQPIKYGFLNISEKYPLETVCRDLENICMYLLEKKLNIPRKSFGDFYIVLVLPDVFHREQIKVLTNLFLRNLGFKAIYLHVESVLACFGASLSQACVVDIGADKINICCVDEGCVVANTLIRKNYGGNDINYLISKTLGKRLSYLQGNKLCRLDYDSYCDRQTIEKLKEVACYSLQNEEASNKVYELINMMRAPTDKISVSNNETFYVAPNAIYYGELLNAMGKRKMETNKYFNFNSPYFENYVENEDYLEEMTYILMPGTGQLQINLSREDIVKTESEKSLLFVRESMRHSKETLLNPFEMIGLDELISISISRVKDPELRKKMANNILIVGGTTQFNNFIEQLEDRLIDVITEYDSAIDRVEVISSITRDIPPNYLSWVGGTVIPRLESMKDLWITRNKWLALGKEEEMEEEEDTDKRVVRKEKTIDCGIRYLKEKVPFPWP